MRFVRHFLILLTDQVPRHGADLLLRGGLLNALHLTLPWPPHVPRPHPSAAAATLLLSAERLSNADALDAERTVDALRAAVTEFARGYAARHAFDDSSESHDVVGEILAAAPTWLAHKLTTVLRKLNYLGTGSPYVPNAVQWDEYTLRDELASTVAEVRSLVAHLSNGSDVPPFRGESAVRCRPGDLVAYHVFDWGAWEWHRCVVVAVTPPFAMLRFQDHHTEVVDTTLSLVVVDEPGVVDFTCPVERRRAAFERLLLDEDLLGEDARPVTLELGMGRVLYTCPCCGYLTRRRRRPLFPRLGGPTRPTTTRCALCSWADCPCGDHPEDAACPEANNADVALSDARANFELYGRAFAPGSDASGTIGLGAAPDVARQTRVLFDGLIEEPAGARRAAIWSGLQAVLDVLEPGVAWPRSGRGFGSGVDRIRLRVREAAAHVDGQATRPLGAVDVPGWPRS